MTSGRRSTTVSKRTAVGIIEAMPNQTPSPPLRARARGARRARTGSSGDVPGERVCPRVAHNKVRPRAAHQLPPGRHKLDRDFVERNQRQRILDAIVDVASLVGYAAMSIEEIIRTAGVSRRTFYDLFSSKEEAFLEAIEAVSDALMERVWGAYDAAEDFPGAIRDGLAAFLQFLADEPRYADL